MTGKHGVAWAVGGLLAAGIAAALLLGWVPWGADGVHHLDAGNDGAVIALEVDERIDLRLEGNATTGWAWTVTAVDPAVLAPVGEPGYETSGGGDGAGGIYTFRFDAVGAGETQVVLEYAPTWDSPEATPQTFTFTATVG
jgi:inhibitor of cysteine peptidase